ncbi:Thiol-disulfide oxidoreductase ResA [Gemmata obscuriglobus]|uniref:Thioredoxin domain-containing protein n=1 Tax=Gemmata obscuriglobus TaxID=114 RepID=A0A2Z3H3Y5_9BACT|nr:TlpA disulfide reductase family protein [Gemmata obscuriglobus]AWM35680.1 hypothetical protein C1280_00675 [Gemmata obscuriglobus]QEG31793.1 Thiol-disulfide oxidoreductase ResA [Gemmata obscuriglobus]VTS11138.1 thiol-disulfide isomerase-like thioredoxin : Thiol-disulfide isomerase-like thioredoxin OS=Singulisphaera acidiphila (strain ATCC BAA-1392 / DSM 18658 / VKM B-2454 / MOB10) GN=Sinac_1102 PE=4 SV=1: AhpC-TSA [Gemmata obscuriglobus UQM 2246]
MRCVLFGAVFCGVSFLLNPALADPPTPPASSPPRDQPAWVAEIEAAVKVQKGRERKMYEEYAARGGKAKAPAEQDAVDKWAADAGEELKTTDRAAARALMPLLREHAADPQVYMGLAFATMHGGSDDREEAGALMGRHHLSNPIVLSWAQFGRGGGCDDFREPIIRGLLAERARTPKERALLQFALAVHLKEKAEVARMSDPSIARRYGRDFISKVRKRDAAKLEVEALGILDQLVAKQVPGELHRGVSIVERAKEEAYEVRHLAVGKKAPEVVGEDLDGRAMKLSDYRGKVAVLTFWHSRCGPCHVFARQELKLVARFAGRPFAAVGANVDEDRDAAKAVVEGLKLPWRSFWCGPKGNAGEVPRAWNVSGWPTVYVIDHAGVIRAKAVRGPELDGLLDELVKKAEADAPR